MPARLSSAFAVIDWLQQGFRHEPCFVAVDGHSAAGKSTLSRAFGAAFPRCQVIAGDDFYRVLHPATRAALTPTGGYAHYFDWQRLAAQVLRPLRAGRTARYQAYDWDTNTLGAWRRAVPEGMIVVEGIYSARPELAAYYDAIICVEAALALRMQRQRERGDEWAWIERWEAAELHYLHVTRLPERAQVVFNAH